MIRLTFPQIPNEQFRVNKYNSIRADVHGEEENMLYVFLYGLWKLVVDTNSNTVPIFDNFLRKLHTNTLHDIMVVNPLREMAEDIL